MPLVPDNTHTASVHGFPCRYEKQIIMLHPCSI